MFLLITLYWFIPRLLDLPWIMVVQFGIQPSLISFPKRCNDLILMRCQRPASPVYMNAVILYAGLFQQDF